MKFEKCLETSKLIYWNNINYNIEVSENSYYRWLSFDGVIQSIMSKRMPWRLIFPHQYAMMTPLLFLIPKSIFELGLGGGSSARFISYLSTNVEFFSIETSGVVIDCFQNYFSPRVININIIHDNFTLWSGRKNHQNHSWYLFDIYKTSTNNDDISKKIEHLLKSTPTTAFLSINLPKFDESEINQQLSRLKVNCLNRNIHYFDIPHYKNLVIIVFPENTSPQFLQVGCLLPNHSLRRWQNLWSHGKKINSL